jgi:hypothetical protein
MRTALAQLGTTQRHRFAVTVERYGFKPGWKGWLERTILLRDVCLVSTGATLCDHLWFTCGKQFERLNLEPGDRVEFDARVDSYVKGYQGRRAEELGEAWTQADWRLSRPTKIRRAVNKREATTGASPR